MSIVSAIDVDNNTDIETQSDATLNEINEKNHLETSDDTLLSEHEDSHIIYVGQNKTTDGGNGTEDNPFNSFERVCNNLTGEEKVEINVYNGTYYLDSDLKFNTNNLIITGVGEVLIKNLRNEAGAYSSFGLTSTKGNFTFNNLIFDGSNCSSFHTNANRAFNVFKGTAKLGVFNNCTFINFTNTYILPGVFDKKFNTCNFLGISNQLGDSNPRQQFNIEFNDCVISALSFGTNDFSMHTNIIFNDVWFGSNTLPGYVYYRGCDDKGAWVNGQMFTVNRYAIFSASENYLGDNAFEIIGKLTWNDGTNDGFEKLNHILVKLFSKTGNLSNEAFIENGTFKAIYKSNSIDNEIFVELDNEELSLNFKNDIKVIAGNICYGDDQNITIILPPISSSSVNITVNNKTYEIKVIDSSTFNFTVPDILNAGTYKIEVLISDSNNHIYGYNSTNWTISKVNKEFHIVNPVGATISDNNIYISLLFEEDASGYITLTVGNKNITHEIFGGNNLIDISKLISIGDNEINIFYSGNEKYLNQTKIDQLTVNKVFPNIKIIKPVNSQVSDKNINITIVLPNNSTGNVTILNNDNNLTYKNCHGELSVDISKLLKGGNNEIIIKYSGDDWWDSQVKKESIYVFKLTPNITVNVLENTNVAESSFIQVTSYDVCGNITLIINGKVYNQILNNGVATFKIYDLAPGNYNAIITYIGDETYNEFTDNLFFTIPKPVLKANDMTMSYQSSLKYRVLVTSSGNPVIAKAVTVTVNGKRIIANTDNNGFVSVKIDLPPKSTKYSIIAEYQGVSIVNKIKVNSIVKAKNVKVKKSAKALKIKVSLKKVDGKYLKGKKITLKFKGKTYKAKTNKKGVATFKISKNIIKKLKIGKKYNYKVICLKDTVTKKVTVKK